MHKRRSLPAALAREWRGPGLGWRCRVTGEHVGYRARETRQHLCVTECLTHAEAGRLPTGAVYADSTCIWIEHPDQGDTRLEVFRHLHIHLPGEIVGGDHREYQIRHHAYMATRHCIVGQATAAGEGPGGKPHRVR